MHFPLQQPLLNEAIQHGVEEILRQMPAAYTPQLERTLRQCIRQAVLFYAYGMDSWARRLHPIDHGQKSRA